jgi:hypothetical protein
MLVNHDAADSQMTANSPERLHRLVAIETAEGRRRVGAV